MASEGIRSGRFGYRPTVATRPGLTRPLVGLLAVAVALSACGGGASGSAATTSSAAARPVGPPSGLVPTGETDTGVPVARVVDGDTIHVLLDGREVTVRLIGINTPETVKPDSPVECFGPEASDFAKQELTGATVTLEYDASQGRLDRYGRTLAYVWRELPGGQLDLFNLTAVEEGFARERQYGPVPYAWESEFRSAQDSAKADDAGIWGACS